MEKIKEKQKLKRVAQLLKCSVDALCNFNYNKGGLKKWN